MAVFQEKSLLQIWAKTLPKLPKNRFNSLVSKIGLSLGAIPFLFGPIEAFAHKVGSISTDLMGVYASLMGFIIASYAIFTTVGQPRFLVAMWKHVDSGTQLPLLKLHLLVFVKLFLALFWSLLLVISLSIAGHFASTIEGHVQVSRHLVAIYQAGALGTIGWSVSATAVQLKAMIFNLYDLTLTQVRFEEIEPDEDQND